MMELRTLGLALALVTSGCASAAPPPREPTQSEWSLARERLAELRQTVPKDPWVEQVTISFREPGTGKIFEGRGAIAVLPGRAMRMILVGPGGSTALDAWVTPDAYRFAVPPISLVRRGGRDAEPGLPIGFFRWWFLAPYAGRLRTIVGRELVLDDGAGVVTIDDHVDGGARIVSAKRRHGAVTELLGFRGSPSGNAAKGDHASYRNLGTKLTVAITVDALGEDAPDPDAFVDPDLVPSK
ncbi:hypothetical protein BH09MYX1_BH09MYX1_40970 [soil metagenome]